MISLPELIRRQAESTPDAIAILAPGRRPLSYARLNCHVEEVVRTLGQWGIGRNDRIAVVLPDGPEMAVATLALASCATCAPLHPSYRTNEFDFHFAGLNCKALLVLRGSESSAIAAAQARAIPIIELVKSADAEAGIFTLHGGPIAPARAQAGFADAEDAALALHTSGTTARAKLALLKHRNICASAFSIRDALELTAADRCLSVMPLFHIHGLSTIFASLSAGGSVICTSGFAADPFFGWLAELAPTWYSAAPAIHQSVLEASPRYLPIAAHSSLRFLRSASAAMPKQVLEELEHLFGVPLIEAYGMTEAAPQIASNRLSPQDRRIGSVGRAAGPEIAILGEAGKLLSPGETGEIAIRGANVIDAYDDHGKRDRSSFVDGWLRTGDLGRLDDDGSLFITGRIKEIINRGGEKISPREVEEVLLDHPAVAQAATFAMPHPLLGEAVAAAIVTRENTSITEAQIRQFAASRLAYFKVPQRIVFVEEIPKSSTGKLERICLAEKLGLDVPAVPLPTALEEKIADIWASVLQIKPPGPNDDFFRLGGHSLSATQIAVRLRQEFQVDLPVESVFANPTVAELAQLISNGLPGIVEPVLRRNLGEASPLSFAQERLWFLDRMEPGSPAYNICSSLWLNGVLDQRALQQSLDEIRRRHAILRTTFRMRGDRPVQVVSPAQATKLDVADLAGLQRDHRAAEALRLAAQEAEHPFDLTEGPLFRATLVRLNEEEHALLLTTHHIVSDLWSTKLLYRELAALYQAFHLGKESSLPEPVVQYADFAVWQREWLQGDVLRQQLDYWTAKLRHPPGPIALPADRPRGIEQTHRGATKQIQLDRDLMESLKSVSEQAEATVFMTAMAAFQVLLHHYSGQEDFVVGTPVANRIRLETEPLIGLFANTLALRADLSGNPSFRDLLARVRSTSHEAYAHQDLPFEKLVERLQPKREAHRTPVFQVMFAFQSALAPSEFEIAPGLTARPLKTSSGAAKFDLTLYLWETPLGLKGEWQYNAGLFNASTIDGMADHFNTLLLDISQNPGRSISELAPKLPAKSHDCFPHLFEKQTARNPDSIAVECGDVRLTYRDLNARANQLARHLRRLDVGPETVVGISLPRSAEMVVAVLGVLKAGGAYVALDPEYPDERLAFLLNDSQLRVLVTEERLVRSLKPHASISLVCLDALRKNLAAEDQQNFDAGISADNLAYVIYTSGSSGQPKGVMVTHGNMRHCATAMREAIGVRPGDRYVHTASFSFSSSVRQLTVPLACGATVVVALTAEIRDPGQLFALIRRTRSSILDIVPSYWRTCLQELRDKEPAFLDSVRLILSASERLVPDLLRDWSAGFGHGAQLINMYGQTETTGITVAYPIPAFTAPEYAVPIGRPIPNTRVQILDALQNPVPPGAAGEIYVEGAGVARGYLHHPVLTAERFLGDASRRLYRTGDRARYLEDGNIEFLGRMDDQIKIRGFRIEPQEVEAALRQHPWVSDAAVVAQQDPAGRETLAAFVVAKETAQPERWTSALRDFLQGKLPDYMVPSAITPVAALPLNANLKIDRKALAGGLEKHTNGAGPASALSPAGPRTPAEKILADIWQKVLHLERVSVQDNFFDLGGDSLLSVGMISRANKAGLAVSLKQLFQHQTIAELARAADAASPPKIATESKPILRVTLDSLRAWGREALEGAGLPPDGASIITEVQIEASLRGQPTHNVDSIPRYARRILAGAMNPRPNIRIEHETAVSAQMDGDNGPGQWVAVVAMEAAIRKAREKGIGIVTVRRSNHFGAAGQYVWMAAQQGLIGLCTTNGPVILAPAGGITPTFGNNPLGVGIPAGRHFPILLDIAMSVAPRGKIGLQLAEGKPLPPGWILDRFGRSSIDPADLAAGLGVPIGGHKGYGLALVLEVLAGVLPAAGFCTDHRREQMRNHSEARDLGHFFMAIDPELVSPLAEFTARVDRMIEITKAGERAHNVEEILIPGEAELRERARNLEEGVPVRLVTYRALLKYAEAARLNAPLVLVE